MTMTYSHQLQRAVDGDYSYELDDGTRFDPNEGRDDKIAAVLLTHLYRGEGKDSVVSQNMVLESHLDENGDVPEPLLAQLKRQGEIGCERFVEDNEPE